MLRADGFGCPVYVMDSAGGVMSAEHAAQRPIFTIESGGAAGVVAAGQLGVRYGLERVLSFDMGGTTAKAGLVLRGQPRITHHFEVSGKGSFGVMRAGSGLPVKTPVVDLAEVGAGGGSIAWVDGTGRCGWDPGRRAPTPAPRATDAAAPSRPSPTPISCSATSTPRGSPMDVRLDVAAAEYALDTQRRRPARAWQVPSRPPAPCMTSPSRRWPRPFASSRCSAARTRARR